MGRAPLPPLVRIGQGEGGRGGAPPFPFPPLSFPLRSYSHMEGGSPTPGGSRIPPGATSLLAGRTPLLLYIQGQGGTLETQKLIV